MAKRRRLKSMDHVRILLADTLRALERVSPLDGPTVDPDTAKLIIYGAKVLGELVRGAKVEERLDHLEQMLEQGVSQAPGVQTSVLDPAHYNDDVLATLAPIKLRNGGGY